MGYTHYWRASKGIEPEVKPQFLEAVRAVLAHPSCPRVVDDRDDAEDPPEITEDHVCFNGPSDESCETFWLSLDLPIEFKFTKTRELPYDAAVVAVLTLAHHFDPEWLVLSSDGDAPDWDEGVELARLVVPDCVNPLQPETSEVSS